MEKYLLPISIIKREVKNPVTPMDLKLSPKPVDLPLVIINDGKLFEENLIKSGVDREWLVNNLSMRGIDSIEEIHNANQDLTKKELFDAGMNVGKDIMGTMTNTLILAYTGSSIPLLLLFMAYETSMIKIINLDIIATEIVRSLSGSIGLVLTIPLTALISTVLIKEENPNKKSQA